MKLLIQIPCYNEQHALPLTLSELPRKVPGFDCVEWLVVDDGSSDETFRVAIALGVDHVVRLDSHVGLAQTYMRGLEACVRVGADVIVNTDADNQYRAVCIESLVTPILQGKADYVIGTRDYWNNPEFSWAKKALLSVGSRIVSLISGVTVRDVPCGFRACTRRVAQNLRVTSRFSYTIESIVSAAKQKFIIENVPILTNPSVRPSRLFKSNTAYVIKSFGALVRCVFFQRA